MLSILRMRARRGVAQKVSSRLNPAIPESIYDRPALRRGTSKPATMPLKSRRSDTYISGNIKAFSERPSLNTVRLAVVNLDGAY